LRYNLNSAAATAYAEKYSLERMAEWSSRIMAGSISVEDGHRWAGRALVTELEQCAAEYRAYRGQVLQEKDLANALNARWQELTPSKSTLQVLGWGAWAELRQREVCELVEETFYWMNELLGVPDDAQNFRRKVTKQLGAIELFPLISFDESDAPNGKADWDDKIRRLMAAHPEKLTFARWGKIREPLMRNRPTREVLTSIAPMLAWFPQTFLEGTAYDSLRRRDSELLGRPPKELERLKQIAPYDFNICWASLRRSTNFRPTFEQTTAEFSELGGYNLQAMHTVAESAKNDPERYVRLYESICRVDPDRYVNLGDYLQNQGYVEKAVRAYQNAFDHAPDRVRVSNNCEWLVNYYFDHGRKDEAFAIAKYAAEVYSASGLETMARLLERTGDLEGAEEYFKKIEERYSGHSDTTLFYLRNQAKSARYAAAAKEGVARMFPHGIESASLNNLLVPPRDGVVVSGSSNVTLRIGLQPGDVLAGIDGQRIHNRKQYYFVRDGSNNPNISYIVWRNGKYLEIKANLPGRQIKATIEDYSRREANP
jgi:tetratricopeptide (TPR) repeat protein